jgi:hypothetical protein
MDAQVLAAPSVGQRRISVGSAAPEGPRDAHVIGVSPSHQFPVGSVLSARRVALLDFARACNAGVIEDDYDGEFRFGGRPLDALHTLDCSLSARFRRAGAADRIRLHPSRASAAQSRVRPLWLGTADTTAETSSNSLLKTVVRACNNRCAPRSVQCICCFLTNCRCRTAMNS